MKSVILLGGSGNRLWPLSRKKYPKQFLKVSSERSLFQDTIIRNKDYVDNFILITNDQFNFIVRNQMQEIDLDRYKVLLEKIGRNTAPAIALACLACGSDELIFVVPSDHKISGSENYQKALERAKILAEQGYLVTFGITPDSPQTGYGYIKYNGEKVTKFIEKPDESTAEQYLLSGQYLWNSGMFLFKARIYLSELSKYRKDIYDECVKTYANSIRCNDEISFNAEDMKNIPSDSIDYAVLEKSSLVKVVKSDFKWCDVGSFEAFDEFVVKDKDGNSISANTLYNQSKNALVINDASNKLLVLNKLEDIVIINTQDATYISKLGTSQDIKEIIAVNENLYSGYFNADIREYRPWGYFEVLVNSEKYKVKRMVVYPKKRLSLQRHNHRSEHWTIVEGIATITLGDNKRSYKKNESAFISIGELHRVENESDDNVIIIETALGDILDEEDIIRIEDDYKRI